jgi:outer membrane receptor protein involved in Fe transport
MKIIRIILLSIAAALPLTAAEKDDSSSYFNMDFTDLMEVKVVTASKKEELIDDAPNLMYVVTAEQIKRRGYKSLQDIFQVIPGFGVFHRDLQFVAQVRGIAPNSNEKIAFMINGHIINQVVEPEVFAGSGLRLDAFERIEIIVGPGSVLYGGEPLCAIVNMITKKTNDKEVQASVGNYDTYSVTASIGQSDDDSSHYIYASYSENSGFDAWLKNSENPRSRGLAGTDLTGQLYPSLIFIASFEKGDWSASFFGQNSQMPELHLHGFGVADDARRYDYIYSAIIENKTEWNDSLTSVFKVGGDVKRMLRTLNSRSADMPDHPSWDLSQTSYEAEYALQYKVGRSFAQAGVQYKLKQHRHNYDYLWDPDRPYTFEDATMRSIVEITDTYAVGAYISEEYQLLDSLKLTGAVRFDQDTIIGDDIYTSPRFAAVYKPSKIWVSKLIYNKASHLGISPWGSDLNHMWGSSVADAPDWARQNPNASAPEVLEAIEFQNIFYISRSRLAINVYHQDLTDYYSWFSPFTTVGDFKGNGCEIDLVVPVNERISVWSNFSLSDNDFSTAASLLNKEDTADGDDPVEFATFQLPANDKGEVVAVPAYTANLGLDWMLKEGIYGSTTVRYFDKQPMYLDGKWDYANNRYYLDASLLLEDFIVDNMTLGLVGRNLLNNRDPVGTQWLADAYRPRGASFELTLGYRF